MGLDCGHYYFSGGYQDFFIGQGDVFACFDGFVGGWKAYYAYCGGDYHFRLFVGGYSVHAFWAEEDFWSSLILFMRGI